MTSNDIRRSFIDFFAARGHRELPSGPLVPSDDPTLLFANAGMVQFKDYFTGAAQPTMPRAVTSQKCMRVSGKHNDLENVGPSPRHHTFFEMLGNFSFGDYFKEEAIRFGWELVTGVWGLPAERLTATVFEEDDEAAELWLRLSTLPAERILRCGRKENFWEMGETGPCGPCSEIFVDLRPDLPAVGFQEGSDSGRLVEIWNLVFMQFERFVDGTTRPLPKPSVDTGAGLERVSAVLQGVASNYDTDLFQPLLAAAAAEAGTTYGADAAADVSLRVIADHLRAVTFLLADGVIPGSEGRGYVLRRILRRALRHGMRLGFEEPFLHRLLPVLGRVMGGVYGELRQAEEASRGTVRSEEEKFLATVAAASRQVQETVDRLRAAGEDRLPGPAVFRLYDTYGLPLEMIEEIAEEEQFGLDLEGFEQALAEQRERSRAAIGDSRHRLAQVRELLRGEATGFTGYSSLHEEDVEVVALAELTDGGAARVERIGGGGAGVAVLERTPFYGESGGQVGDRGRLEWDGGAAVVEDTQKDATGTTFHFLRLERGELAAGQRVTAAVDEELRRATQRNHTATHLLHLALRQRLGSGVRQAGSLVAPERLRFDFTYSQPVDPDELRRIEQLVNRWILLARETRITEDRDYQEAVRAGAMALFGEKYGDRVRTVEVRALPDAEAGASLTSLELCGGCHVANIGEIGPLLITAERGVASGVRRIEALTGDVSLDRLRRQGDQLAAVGAALGTTTDGAAAEAAALRERLRSQERELSRLRLQAVAGGGGGDEEVEVEGVRIVAREVPPAPAGELRNLVDVLRGKLGSGVVVLGTRGDDRVSLVAAVSGDLTDRLHAGRLVGAVAGRVGGKGGGRPDFAQAGGREPDKLAAALAAVPELVREALGGGRGGAA
jgi:alanyl-tRNA synthetase